MGIFVCSAKGSTSASLSLCKAIVLLDIAVKVSCLTQIVKASSCLPDTSFCNSNVPTLKQSRLIVSVAKQSLVT